MTEDSSQINGPAILLCAVVSCGAYAIGHKVGGHELQQIKNMLIGGCESSIPRNQNCKMVYMAEVDIKVGLK